MHYVVKSIRSGGVGIGREKGVAIGSELTPEGLFTGWELEVWRERVREEERQRVLKALLPTLTL